MGVLERPHEPCEGGQVDVEGHGQVLGGREGRWRSACRPALLPAHRRGRAPLQHGRPGARWHHPQEAEGGGISAVSGTGSVYTFYGPEEKLFANLTKGFIEEDMAKIMPSLGLSQEPLPLWWTSDFINASPVGTPPEKEKWIVGEFNCSCVGISRCLPAFCNKDNPNATWNDIPPADKEEAMKYGNKMGEVALKILDSSKKWF